MRKRRFTDAELLTIELVDDDPYSREGLVVERLPLGVTIVDAVGLYSYGRYPADRMFCCVCGKRRHREGYFAKRSDGRVSPLGNCCAVPILEKRWRDAVAALNDERKRQRYVRELHALKSASLNAISMLAPWRQLARKLRDARYTFNRAMPEIYELVKQACNQDGLLMATQRVRKLKWENRKDRKDENEKDGYTWVHVPVYHTLLGTAFLRSGDPLDYVEKVDDALRNYASVARNTEHHGTPKLASVSKTLHDALNAMRFLGEMRDAVPLFFSRPNLAGIVRWSNLLRAGHDKRLPYDIELCDAGLAVVNSSKFVTAPELPEVNEQIYNTLHHSRAA